MGRRPCEFRGYFVYEQLYIYIYIYELFYQRSVVELAQLGHIPPPNKLFDVDVVDVAAGLFSMLFILDNFDIHI